MHGARGLLILRVSIQSVTERKAITGGKGTPNSQLSLDDDLASRGTLKFMGHKRKHFCFPFVSQIHEKPSEYTQKGQRT